MKRYLLFYYPQFYPSGGWNDLEGIFGTMKELRAFVKAKEREAGYCGGDWQVVDTRTCKVVEDWWK